jgi:nicotinamide-nucleotide adenylyltransferase
LKIGLLVGRFQPFHYGHLAAVKFALGKVEYLYIAIGSAQKSHERENPFTAGERIEMIKAALDGAGIDGRRWMAIPVPDAESHSIWVSTVVSLVPRFDVVFTNDSLTYLLFKEKGFKVIAVPYKNRKEYSATNVRNSILERKDWKKLVPPEVARLVVDFRGEERVRMLMSKDIEA